MTEVLGIAAIGTVFAAVLGVLAWLGARVRRNGRVGGADAFLGPIEDIWHPLAHRARIQVQAVEERMVPMPSPDDKLTPGSA